jgi:Family of unknown function (DUF6455)
MIRFPSGVDPIVFDAYGPLLGRVRQKARRRMLAALDPASVPGVRRVVAMMQRIGVDPGAASTGMREALGSACLACIAQDECDAWLASGATSGEAAFCPNAARFASLRQQAK